MNERGRNEADISRYTDVEYSPEGYKTVYRWGDFWLFGGFCGRDSGIGPAQRAKTTIWN